MEERLLNRNEVPEELTWDLSRIFKTKEDLDAAMARAEELCRHISETYRGKLDTPEAVTGCLDEYREYIMISDHIETYVELAYEVDYTNSENEAQCRRYESKIYELGAGLKFINAEIMAADPETIGKAMEMRPENRCYLAQISREKPHTLSLDVEETLKKLSSTLETPYDVYLSAKNADMDFGTFSAGGKEYPLGYSLFEEKYEYETDTCMRREAYRKFYEKLAQYRNVTATAYNACVTREKTISKLRGFDSVFDYLLFDQQIPRESYDRQLDTIMEKLAPHMRRYAGLIQRLYGLDKMTWFDLKIPVDKEYDPVVTIQDAREYILKGLAIMGDDYKEVCRKAFDERWIDFANNRGKCTGGFCASPYRKGSYILLSWNDRISDLMTVAHELGHAGHFYLCGNAQSSFDTMVSNYFVEAPSTMNELLMSNYMLSTSDDKRFRRYILSNMISNTYYHNFVTHFLEAYYQREVYKIIDEGGSVQADTLSGIFRETLEKFWGDAVEIPKGAELTWMRQPHYYMGLYSYTYSAGLSIGTEVSNRIRTEGAPMVEAWKKTLAAGSTKNSVDLAGMAGVDMTTAEPFENAIATIGKIIDEIIELSE